jgi:hypothetical protein
MGALRRSVAARSDRVIIAISLLAGLGSVIGILALSHSASAPAIGLTAPVKVAVGFDQPFVQFGDRFVARVVVALDTRLVRTQTLRISDDLAPLTQLGPARTSSSTQDRVELVTLTVPVACLTAPCIAGSGRAQVHLPFVQATVLERDARTAHTSVRWPALDVRGRVTAADLAPSTPPFKADAAPLPPTYRIAPATLVTLLDVLAVVSAVAGIGLIAREVHLQLRHHAPRPAELERALMLTRQAKRRPVADRRRALSLLSRALGGDRRSRAARRLAWSESEPEADELEELVVEIERGRAE